MIKIIRLFLYANLLIVSTSLEASTPNVLEYFPQCDYQVLDTQTFKYKVKKSNNGDGLTQQELTKTMQVLLRRMQDRAIELNADAILLIDREINAVEEKSWTKNQNEHILVKFTAEIINQCQAIPGRAKKPTPFDKLGAPQKQIQLGNVGGWQQQIEFAMPSSRKRIEPELTSVLVAIDSGVYGVSLSSTYAQVTKAFGTPTISVQLNQQQQLIAYGRRHWFWFIEDKLVKVATEAGIFETEFTNLLAFDDRFERQNWSINGTIQKNHTFQAESETFARNGTTLKILSDTFSDQTRGESVTKVIGFELYLDNAEILNQIQIADTKPLQVTINNYLHSENTAELLKSELKMQPIARVWKDATTELLLFDDHMVIEVTGKSVSAVNYLDKVFTFPQSHKWHFNRVKQGQTLKQVMSILGDDAFEFDGVVEYSANKYLKELYFENVDGKMRLYASEVAIY